MRERATMYGLPIISLANWMEALEKINEGVSDSDKRLNCEDLGYFPPSKMSFDNTEITPDEGYVVL